MNFSLKYIILLFRYYSIISIIIFLNFYSPGQAIDLNSPLAIDPNIKTGKLDNGLTYYIRNNHKPENRVFMYLALKAGSINEDNDQQGLAHFVEHMAFNGTLHFKKNELVDAMEKMGGKYGAELNAHTGYNETVYNLELPSDNTELIEKGFLILEDWAHNISFDDKEIEREKGVIKEEWRLRGGEDLPVLLKDSRYAERTPIGKMEIITDFTLRFRYLTGKAERKNFN